MRCVRIATVRPDRTGSTGHRGACRMLGATLGADDYLERVCAEIRRLDPAQLETLAALIEEAYHAGRFVFICGNGGSGANASHLCEDLAKGTLRDFEHQK